MAAGQGNKLTNPIYTSKKVNGRYVPNDSRSYVDYLTDITSISNAYTGMKVLVWKEDENAQTELNKWYKVTAVNLLGKPTEYEEDGGVGISEEQEDALASIMELLLNGATVFNESQSFSIGDVVNKDGVLYRFTHAHSGVWDDNHVTIVTISWIIAQLSSANVETESSVVSGSIKPIQSGAVYTALQSKANTSTTLSGYGITDAKIANGAITLGSNTITPLTSHQDISGKADTADVGNKTNLTTTAKGTLVAAINEIDANVGAARVMLYNILNGTSYSTIAQIEAAEQQNNA